MIEHVSELLSSYLDGQASLPERLTVEEHLAGCAACRSELENLRQLTGLLRRLPSWQPPRSFAIGPQAVRPAALRGTFSGYLRALSSVAAGLLVIVVSFSLIFQGLARQAPAVAAGAPFAASASAARPEAGAARAAQPAAASVAAPSPPAASLAAAAPKPAASAAPVQVAQAGKPAAGLAGQATQPPNPAPTAKPAASAQTPAAVVRGPLNVPRLAGELLLLLVAVAVALYSLRWWRS